MIRSDTLRAGSSWRSVPPGFRINWGQAGREIAAVVQDHNRNSRRRASGITFAILVISAVVTALYWSVSDMLKRPRIAREVIHRMPPPAPVIVEAAAPVVPPPAEIKDAIAGMLQSAGIEADMPDTARDILCCANDRLADVPTKVSGVTHTTFVKVADFTWVQVQSCALAPRYLKCA